MANLLGDVTVPAVQGVRDVLDEDRQRLQLANPGQPALVKPGARIPQKRLWVARDRTELRPADPGEGLAGRAADDDVDRLGDRTQAQGRAQAPWRHLRIGHIPGHYMMVTALMKIESMTGGRLRIRIETCQNLEASALQPE